MSTHSRQAIAAETIAILDRGSYTAPSGRTVSIADRQARAARLYRPDELGDRPANSPGLTTRIEVTGETTLAAARRLADSSDSSGTEPACLNFASAKNPGGGFQRGAHAQEEGLARASSLYASLREFPEFYDRHRAEGDPLYSDHMIYSPGVTIFRTDDGVLLEDPYEVAFLTSPAPNRGAVRDPAAMARIPGTLRRRAAKILALAHSHGHDRLVLGAWGCGVFGNDPDEVAGVFAGLLLADGAFAGAFAQVVFAVWDPAPGAPRQAAFERALR